MKNRFLILFSAIATSLLFISCSSIERPTVIAPINHYQITHVNVIDVINEKINTNQTVEVKNSQIIAIYTTPTKNQASSAIKTIDGQGKYLIPGLWDNHSTVLKLSPEIDFPLYIANGVTSLRSNLSCPNEDKMSLYACMSDKAQWKNDIAENRMLGPTIHGWGTFPVNGKKPHKNHPDLPAFHGATTIEDAKKTIDYYDQFPESNKPHFIKIYNWVLPEPFIQLSQYAKQKGFELAGHMPRALTLKDVVNAGQRSIAHARLFMFDCSNIANELRTKTLSPQTQASIKTTISNPWKLPLAEQYRLLIQTFDAQKCQEKYQYLAKKNVFLNPTLITRRNDYYAVAGLKDKFQGLEYAHYLIKMEFEEDHAKLGLNLTKKDIDSFKHFYHLSAQTIAQAQKAGVKILAGSDSWSEYNIPGFSLHEELQALKAAGLNHYAVLQAATINGALYFNVADKIGSIDVGKQANMVLLDANPIEDIKHTQTINTVFKGQQIYPKNALTHLKSNVKDLSTSHILTLKMIGMFMQNPGGF